MRTTARYVFVVLATVAAVLLLWQFRLAAVLFLLSLCLAAALRPVISNLVGRGLPRKGAMALAYGGLVAVILLGAALLSRPLGSELQQLTDEVVSGYDRIKMDWPRGGTLFQRTLAEQLPPSEEFYGLVSDEEGLASLLGAIGAAQRILTGLGRAAIVIVLSMYWSADRRRFERLSLSLLPAEHDERIREAWVVIEASVGAYLRGEALQSMLAGIVLGFGFWLIGAPYPGLLAVWVATVRLVPWFGVVLALLPSLAAILIGVPAMGMLTAAITLLVLVTLRLTAGAGSMGLRRYHPVWMLICLVAMAELLGFGGAIIAPLVGIVLQLVVEQFAPEPLVSRPPPTADRVEALRLRMAALAERLPKAGGQIPAATSRDLDRLRGRLEALAARSGD